MKTIGERIHQMRKKKNMTLEDVAKLTHTTRQTIQRYEAGVVTNIPYDRIILLATALEVTPAYLMGWQDDPPPSVSAKKRQLSELVDEMTDDEAATALAVLKALKQKE